MNPSCNLFIVGPTGAGKTSIGRRLAAHYGLRFIDLDHEIESHCGVDVATVFEIEGEAGFRQRESMLLDDCTRHEGIVLATGGGAILAETNRRWLRERGYVIWLQASVEQQLERLARDTKRPLLAAGDRRAKLEAMAQVRGSLYEHSADLAIPGELEGVPAASDRCVLLIDQSWQRLPASVLVHHDS
ncbi:shikimate kinase [Dyella sp.]|uniref:shikimate kinase n=1 Tax=Dyella sp. TaxID=1869338 RepID=UPI002ED4DB62